jgi:DNA-binding NarL/FixJ family response regulator
MAMVSVRPPGGRAKEMTIRLVVAEDSFLAQRGIASVLADIDGVELAEMSGDLDGLHAAVERSNPDVVLTDIRMPPTNTDEGIQFAAEAHSRHPKLGVVVLSHHADPRYALTLFESGSGGRAYLLKERLTDQAELSRAIHDVAEGRSFVDSRIVDKLVTARRRQNSDLRKLTLREIEILGLIAEGRSNQAIAAKLSISKPALERHINTIFRKLDLGLPQRVSRRVMAALLYLSGVDR